MIKKLLIFILTSQYLFAQTDKPTWGISFNPSLSINQHTGNFDGLESIPNCCPTFESGSGTGIGIGILPYYNLNSKFQIGLFLNYVDLSGDLVETEQTDIILEGQLANGEFEHRMSGLFSSIQIAPLINYKPWKKLNLQLGFSTDIMMQTNFDQIETLTKPTNRGTFVDEQGNNTFSRTRNDINGEIQDASAIMFSAMAAISYDFPLNKNNNFFLAPEIRYFQRFGSMVESVDWGVNNFAVGVGFKYEFRKAEEKTIKKEIIEELDTIEIIAINDEQNFDKKEEQDLDLAGNDLEMKTNSDIVYDNFDLNYDINLNVGIKAIDDNNNEINDFSLEIEEFISHRQLPLLNYIFFEQNSSEIDSRYYKLNQNNTKDFSENKFFRSNTLEAYYDLLNIIGKRLIKYPKADITLMGCNSNIGGEKNNLKLSEDRANAVKNYLTSVWNISEERINIKRRNLPVKLSTPIDDSLKIEENSRVEITSNKYEIIEPIYLTDTVRVLNFNRLVFEPKAEVKKKINSWNFKVYQNGSNQVLFDSSGQGKIPDSFVLDLENNIENWALLNSDLNYDFSVNELDGKSAVDNQKIEINSLLSVSEKRKQKQIDIELGYFKLILFDFNSSQLSRNNLKIVEFIKNKINTDSDVKILGYTDKTGNEEGNKRISMRRAQSSQKAMGLTNAKIYAIGEENYFTTTPFQKAVSIVEQLK